MTCVNVYVCAFVFQCVCVRACTLGVLHPGRSAHRLLSPPILVALRKGSVDKGLILGTGAD